MTLAPRFLINLWAGYRAAKFLHRLKASGYSETAQRAAFHALMAQFGRTAYGRVHRLGPEMTYEQFRATVPPHTYEHFRPFVERMIQGEADVLAPGRCQFFVQSAGTTTNTPKILPVPEPMLGHFRDALRDALFLYTSRAGHVGVFLGRHLHHGASTALARGNHGYCTTLDGMIALSLSPWVEANLYAPPTAVAEMPESPEKTQAAARTMLTRDVTLVAGTPSALNALSQAVRDLASSGKKRMTHLQAVWPNLECCIFTGAPLGLFRDELRSTLGPTVYLHELYVAAEGIFAAQDNGTPNALRLLADTGVFFEFLPLRRFNEDTLSHAGPDCVPVEKVQAGVDYVLVVTTPAGLCRYVPGDIVRFVSTEPPRLQFIGRTKLQLNTFNEHVSERQLIETLMTVCQRNGWQPVNFHVAPLSARASAGQAHHCHEWWIELRTHSLKTPTANVLSPDLDRELAQHNPDYAAKRAGQTLEAPVVRLVMPGVFDQWTAAQRQAGGLSRMPHCRADRQVAEQLASLARFHQSATPFTQ